MTPDEANLRCLEGSVRNLIARLCRHDGSVLRDCIPTTGTISGDLYAIVASAIRQQWDDSTLSDLRKRYPVPKPIDAAPAGNDGSRELPSVPREVSDGGGSAERGGVCGSADVEPPVTDAGPQAFKFMVSEPELPMSYADVNVDSLVSDSQLQELLEQARSTTRRNILKAVDHLNGKLPEKWDVPEQDIAVAMVALRQSIKAECAGDHKASVMERFAFDQMRKAENELKNRELTLRGAIKGRDGKIKDLQAQVDQLSRHIAFQVAK